MKTLQTYAILAHVHVQRSASCTFLRMTQRWLYLFWTRGFICGRNSLQAGDTSKTLSRRKFLLYALQAGGFSDGHSYIKQRAVNCSYLRETAVR